MPLAVAAIGTAYSIYDGTQKAKAAKEAQNQAGGDFAENKQFAQQRYQNWYNTFFPAAKQRVGELMSKNLTPESATALGNLNEAIQKQGHVLDTKTAAGSLSSGAANGAYQDLALRGATGTSGIALQDQAQKNSQLGQWYQMGLSEPTSSYLVQGANRDQAGYADQQAQRFGQDATSDWAAVSHGMMSIADSMAAKGAAPGNKATYAPNGDMSSINGAPVSSTVDQMPTQQQSYQPFPMSPVPPQNQGLGNLAGAMGGDGGSSNIDRGLSSQIAPAV